MTDLTRQIAVIPMFAGLSGLQKEALARNVVRRACRKGERIFSEGDEGSGFYAVISGRVKIFKLSPEGKEQILHFVGPGGSFGEASVFTGHAFPADAVATAQTVLLFLPRASLISLIRNDPALALSMLAQLSQRLRQFAGLIEDLSLKEVPGRFAKYLLYLSNRNGEAEAVELDVSKGQLAALLGTIPETLSRIIAKMNRQGLIRCRGAQIRILDRAGIEEIAQEGRVRK